MTECVIYLRVSTQAQAESGLGREAQLAACAQYAARQGWSVLGVHVDDGKSGTLDASKRPGYAAACQQARSSGAVLLAYSLSRLARSVRLLAEVAATLTIASATEPFDTSTPAGRLMLAMLGAFAAFERDVTAERTRDALAAARGRGTKLGRKPMASELAARVQSLRAQGFTIAGIANELNSSGVASPGGRRWHAPTVRAALAR